MRYVHGEFFWLLILIPLLWAFYLHDFNVRGRWLSEFGRIRIPRRRLLSKLNVSGALLLGIIGLTQPQYPYRVSYMERSGIDILYLMDISFSMMAEDVDLEGTDGRRVFPNRLEGIRRAVDDITDQLQGERVGLVLFAGSSSKILPFSSDYENLRFYLDFFFDTYNFSSKGTSLLSAVKGGIGAFDEKQKQKVLILLSDGEAEREGEIGTALQTVADASAVEGIRFYTVGVGKEEEALIPIRDANGVITGYARDPGGFPIRTKADHEFLRGIAEAGRGRYYRLGKRDISGEIVGDILSDVGETSAVKRSEVRYKDLFPYFFLAAFILLTYKEIISRAGSLIKRGRGIKARAPWSVRHR